MASKTQKRKMQTVLNKALRFINCNEQEQLLTNDLHMKYNTTPLNILNFKKTQEIGKTIKISEPEQYEELIRPYNNTHSWFPGSSTIIEMEPPIAIIT